MPWANLRDEINGLFAELEGYDRAGEALERDRANQRAYGKQWKEAKRKDPFWLAQQKANARAFRARKQLDPAWLDAQKAYLRAWYQQNKAKVKLKAQALSDEQKARKAETTKEWKKKKARDPVWVSEQRQKKKAYGEKKKRGKTP